MSTAAMSTARTVVVMDQSESREETWASRDSSEDMVALCCNCHENIEVVKEDVSRMSDADGARSSVLCCHCLCCGTWGALACRVIPGFCPISCGPPPPPCFLHPSSSPTTGTLETHQINSRSNDHIKQPKKSNTRCGKYIMDVQICLLMLNVHHF